MPEELPLFEIIWTVSVFFSGYLFGRLRLRRDNDLIGPPPSLRRKSMQAPPNASHSLNRPQQLPKSMTEWGQLDPETEAAINEAMARGNKIEAIKILRNASGMGLKESKEMVDRW